MTEITRAEFDALRQKIEEIHQMLVNMGGQPNVVVKAQRYIGAGEVVFGSNVMPETQPLPAIGRPFESPSRIRTIPENGPLPRMEIDP